MAKQIITKLIDDLDGSEAAETVRFSYQGIDYTIDLSTRNAARLRKALQTYADKGVKVTPARRRAAVTDDADTPEGRARIRAWGREHMADQFPHLGDKGRIPAEVVAAYRSRSRNGYL